MKYEFLEHTADLKFKAYGENLNKVFENAALAFFESITDTSKVKQTTKITINIKAQDNESLLYDFLEELLTLHEADKYLFSKFSIDIKDYELSATLWGEKLKPTHKIRNAIKAVTYNDMIVTNNMAQVVLDI